MITPSGFAKRTILKKVFNILGEPKILVDAGCAGAAIIVDLKMWQ